MGTASGPFGTERHDYEGSLGRWAIIPDVKRGLGDRRSVRCLENQRGQNSGKGIADALRFVLGELESARPDASAGSLEQ
jgi:hypothetical protein